MIVVNVMKILRMIVKNHILIIVEILIMILIMIVLKTVLVFGED